jgi:hypothetical protein
VKYLIECKERNLASGAAKPNFNVMAVKAQGGGRIRYRLFEAANKDMGYTQRVPQGKGRVRK